MWYKYDNVVVQRKVEKWILSLPIDDQIKTLAKIDNLAEQGVHLKEPHTRQLKGKLRELKFYISTGQARITYYITNERRIVLLTAFIKSKQRERQEVEKALWEMKKHMKDDHE